MEGSPSVDTRGLIQAIIATGEFPTLASISRHSGRSYQTIHRWANGKVNVSHDDMADLANDLQLDPESLGIRPSREWLRRTGVKGDGGWGPPPIVEAQVATLLDRTADLPQILARLDNMADQLARIEDALKAQQDSPRHA